MAEYPIGDPTGGPAYGEKRDPLSAAISIFTMFNAAEAGFAAMTLMQGISFAGAAISLIGNITGNKTLSSLGMIAGLAGGIGAFAESKGLFDSGNLADTLGLNKGSNVSLEEVFLDPPAPGLQTPVVNGQQVPGSASYNMNAEAANVPNPLDAPSRLNPNDINVRPSINPASDRAFIDNIDKLANEAAVRRAANGGLSTVPSSATTAPAVAPLGEAAAAPTSGLMQPTDYSLMSKGPGDGLKLPNSTGVAAKPGFMDLLKEGKFGDAAATAGSGAMDMLKTNPTGAYVVSKGIGAAVDYLSGKTDAELEQLKASTGYANAKALEVQTAIDREKEKRANKNMAYNTIDAGFKPPGLIRSNMQST